MVLAEDQQVGGGCTGRLGDRRDQVSAELLSSTRAMSEMLGHTTVQHRP
ncbi:hypothetical protein MIU24_14455 [Streptomyces venezuelae]